MTIEVTRRGLLPEKQQFEGNCTNCGTSIKCLREDGEFVSDQRDGDALKLSCPVCKRSIWASATKKIGWYDDK